MSGQQKRGFAAMSPEKQRAIARKGGQAAHYKGTAHEFSSEEARRAGHLGGKAVSANRAHMAVIGRKGGKHSVQRSSTAHARKQSPTTPAVGETSPTRVNESFSIVTDRLRADHRRVNGLFHQYELGEQAPESRAAVLKQLCQELLHHTRLEEDKVYPVVRHVLSEFEQQKIDASLRAHERIKELVRRIEGHAFKEDGVMDLVQELQTCVRQHVQAEEQEILPKAEERIGPELQQLGTELAVTAQHDDQRLRADQQDPRDPHEDPAQEDPVRTARPAETVSDGTLTSATEQAIPPVETKGSTS